MCVCGWVCRGCVSRLLPVVAVVITPACVCLRYRAVASVSMPSSQLRTSAVSRWHIGRVITRLTEKSRQRAEGAGGDAVVLVKVSMPSWGESRRLAGRSRESRFLSGKQATLTRAHRNGHQASRQRLSDSVLMLYDNKTRQPYLHRYMYSTRLYRCRDSSSSSFATYATPLLQQRPIRTTLSDIVPWLANLHQKQPGSSLCGALNPLQAMTAV